MGLVLKKENRAEGREDDGDSPHIICRCAVETFPLVLSAAEKVATPYHHSHLHASHRSLGHLTCNPLNHVRVNSKPVFPREGLSADFQQDPRPLLRTPSTNPAGKERDKERKRESGGQRDASSGRKEQNEQKDKKKAYG